MQSDKNRNEIIQAIEGASDNELKALAEIKRAIEGAGIIAPTTRPVKEATVTPGPEPHVSKRLRQKTAHATKYGSTPQKPQPYKKRTYERLVDKKPVRQRIIASTGKDASEIATERTRRRKSAEKTSANESNATKIVNGVDKKATESTKADNSFKATPKRKKSAQERSEATDGGRDSKGRFTSGSRQEDINRKKEHQREQQQEAKLQKGFFKRLGSLVGMDGRGDQRDDSGATDLAGVSVGGPLWMAVSGALDVAKKGVNKGVTAKQTLDDWSKARKDTKAEKVQKTQDNIPLRYPSATEKPAVVPTLGQPQSSQVYAGKQAQESVKSIGEQTKALEKKDNEIIDALGDVEDEVVKLRKAIKGQSRGGGLFDRFPGRRKRIPGIDRGRDKSRNPRSPDVTKLGKPKPKAKPKIKGKGVFGKLGNVLSSGGAKAVGAITATTAGVFGANHIKKGAEKAAITTTEKATAKATEKAAAATAEKTAVTTSEKATAKATEKATAAAAEKTAVTTTEKATAVTAEKGAAKIGTKAALKTAGRFVPLVGTGIVAAIDAVDGYNDVEGQRGAFGLEDNQEVTGQQKVAYTAANVVDMGGLVSGATGLLGKGFSAIGLESMGDAMQNFDTGTIARGIDSVAGTTQSLFSSAKDLASNALGGVAEKIKSGFSSSDDSTKQIKTAVEDGTRKTVSAIHTLAQLQGGGDGEDGVGQYGYTSVADFSAPSANNIATDLNIGGKNAGNRNFRNNNIGNLNFANQEGATLEAKNAKGEQRFARFNSPEEGIRALGNQVSSYYNGTSKAAGYQKLQSVSAIISKWAPPNENNTNQYIKNVCEYLGVSPTEKIDVSDPEVMTRLVRAIATKEGGNPTVNDNYIKTALGQWNAQSGRWEGAFSDESLDSINKDRAEHGEEAIARNSQYSTGSKVKLASGIAVQVAKSDTPTVPLMTTATNNTAPQQAQSVRKPRPELKSPADKPHAAGTKNTTDKMAVATVIATQHAQQLLDSEGEEEDEDAPQGSILSLLGRMGANSLTAMKNMAGITTPEGLQKALASSKESDKSMSDMVHRLTGKRFGYQQASTPAAVQDAVRRGQQVQGGSGQASVDLLGDLSEYNRPTGVHGHAVQAGDVTKEDKGFFEGLWDSTTNGIQQAGQAILPTVGRHASNLLGGISGQSVIGRMVSNVTGGNTLIDRAVSPLTRAAGGMLDDGIKTAAGGINSGANSLNSAIFGPSIAQSRSFVSPSLPTASRPQGMQDMPGEQPGIFEQITGSIRNNVGSLIDGVSGQSIAGRMVSNVTGGNTLIDRAVSPLTRAAGGMLDSGIKTTSDAIRPQSTLPDGVVDYSTTLKPREVGSSGVNTTPGSVTGNNAGLNQSIQAIHAAPNSATQPFMAMPPTLPTVTDLAGSGVRPALRTDNANNDAAILKTLEGMQASIKELVTLTKNNGKGDPDKVTHTPQPAPRERTSTSISDPSLNALLED